MKKQNNKFDDEAFVQTAEGIMKFYQQVCSCLEETRSLQMAYEGRGTHQRQDLTDNIDALKAIAEACNAPSDSIYAQLTKVEPHVITLNRELDKANRRKQI